jgi:dephospho-CoA kinase
MWTMSPHSAEGRTAWKHGPKPTVGLVGGIGAGKSTAAALLAARGAWVVDADALGHEALERHDVRRRVLDRWGDRVLRADGTLDRRAIGRVVFADPAERTVLEAMVFPYITGRTLEEVRRGQANPAVRFVVVDAAVMLEAGWDGACDRLVYVDAPPGVRLARLAARSGWTAADLAAREAAQWPAEEKMARADAVVVNDGDPARLAEQIDRLLAAWGVPPAEPPPGAGG